VVVDSVAPFAVPSPFVPAWTSSVVEFAAPARGRLDRVIRRIPRTRLHRILLRRRTRSRRNRN
jgi:hypothetical protein